MGRVWAVVLGLLLVVGCKAQEAPVLRLVALGDAPYGKVADSHPAYRALLDRISEGDPELVIHVGDLHGRETCDDARLALLKSYLDGVKAPVLYTPGDNEWTDCHKTGAGPFDPLERLAHIRATFFGNGQSLGAKTLALESQADAGYPENTRVMIGGIGFINVHVVGSNNNFSRNDMDAVREYMARNAADVAWLKESFAAFGDADAVVVALHADMFHAGSGFRGFKKGWSKHSPFQDIGVTLGQESSRLAKPVLLLYGDSHEHKAFQPFPEHRPWLHAIEVHGHPNIKAIEIAVRPAAKIPFEVMRVIEP